MQKIIILFIIVFLTGISGCYNDKEQLLIPPKTGTTGCANYSFTTDVNPLIQSSCDNGAGCHASGSTNGPGALVTYDEIKNASAQISSSVLAGRMPLGTTLTANQIQIIHCWISNGSLNN